MKLAIVNLTGGGLSGGYKKYLKRLLPLLQRHPSVQSVKIYLPPTVNECFDQETVKNISFWSTDDQRRGFHQLKEDIKGIKPDVVFIPTARYLHIPNIPIVIMVRNMEPIVSPFNGNPIFEAVKNIGRLVTAKRSCNKATRIIAVSEYVSQFLIERWSIERERIGTVYHGVDLLNSTYTERMNEKIKGKDFNGFVFTAGSIRPSRGLEDILTALGFIKTTGKRVKLVVGGSIDPGMESYKTKLDRFITDTGIIQDVLWAGRLSEEEMSWCYKNCQLFIMTSRVEACPNIVLEAMANGCVCISTETPPMPEFFQDVAVYYPPKNGRALAEVIQSVLSWSDAKKQQMSELARRRASQFSWDVCAEKTIEQLQLAIEEFAMRKGKTR